MRTKFTLPVIQLTAISLLSIALLPFQAQSATKPTVKSAAPTAKTTPTMVSLSKQIEADPKNAAARLQLGESFMRHKDYARAKGQLAEVMRLCRSKDLPNRVSLASQANDDLLKLPKNVLAINKVNPMEIAGLFGSLTRGVNEAAPRPKVIDFYADWCHPCKMLAPVLEKQKQKYAEKIDFIALNVDDPDNAQLMEKYGVSALPAVVYLNKEGDMVTYSVGYSGEDNVKWDMKQLLETK